VMALRKPYVASSFPSSMLSSYPVTSAAGLLQLRQSCNAAYVSIRQHTSAYVSGLALAALPSLLQYRDSNNRERGRGVGRGARGGERQRGSERGMYSSFCICILVYLRDIFPQCFSFSDITLYYSSIFCLKQSHFSFQYLQASREIIVLGLEGSVDILLQPLHSVAVCAARVIVLCSLKKLALFLL
jgi:hypothetical protein